MWLANSWTRGSTYGMNPMSNKPTIPSLKNIHIYDEECYPNIWTNMLYDPNTDEWFFFEVSDRVNQIEEFRNAMRHWKFKDFTHIGFNNIGYDYPVAHAIITDKTITCAADIFAVSKRIIDTDWNDRFENRIPEWHHVVNQIDLMLVHHFDNQAKSVKLKVLEFVMRMNDIEDLPFKPETFLTHDEMTILVEYQKHDVIATHKFYLESLKHLEFRAELSQTYDKNFMNMNDGKIGEAYFVMGLDKAGVKTKNVNKTYRDSIIIDEIIFPYIRFDHPEFNKALAQMRTETIYKTKGANHWSPVIDGFSYDIGLGGIHASVKGETFREDDYFKIKDLDFASWYPHLSFNHNVYPLHLTEAFCPVYKDLYLERKKHAKKTLLNAALKLALNIPYGNSNSEHSIFYDPKFTMTITINGQLILCMLADQLIKIPELRMIQCNTDGLTIRYPRKYEGQVLAIWKWIEQVTDIELEGVDYSLMAIRDVNNYIAVAVPDETGYVDIKRKGAYGYENLEWHKDHGALVIQKAASAAILEGKNIREFIMNHDDIFDFFKVVKASKGTTLITQEPVYWNGDLVTPKATTGTLQGVTRYYISNTGCKLIKRMPAFTRKVGGNIDMVMMNYQGRKASGGLNKNLKVKTIHEFNSACALGYRIKKGGSFTTTALRDSGVDKDWLVTPINSINDETKYDVNYDYYIKETEKLVNKVI